jgi:alpha-L-fucosidase
MFINSPYAEWYLNSLRIKSSPVQSHHHTAYGADHAYENFGRLFNEQIRHWDPQSWADLFKSIHAKYIVLVTKHHDGFLLWPSRTEHPHRKNWHANRDIVNELTQAVRARGMNMGYYYSGALDWSFTDQPITSISDLITNGPTSKSYADYVHQHYLELIDTYAPEILWNDIAYPPRGNLQKLIAHYYNSVKQGVINDRWIQLPVYLHWLMKIPWVRRRIDSEIAKSFSSGTLPQPKNIHTDYSTPEYTTLQDISPGKWECVRGIGHSFGYNAQEPDANFLTSEELVHMLVDIVSKNGNLLLNVGPMADGTIPDIQLKPLRGLGQWLGVYGEAIFGTRPWHVAEGTTAEDFQVRFTQGRDGLYVTLLGTPSGRSISLTDFNPGEGSSARFTAIWLATREPLHWSVNNGVCEIQVPDHCEDSPAHVVMFARTSE